MMTNLFSIFDPSTSTLSLSWVVIMAPFLLLCFSKLVNSKSTKFFYSFKSFFKKDIKPMLNSNSNLTITMISTMFLFLALSNLSSLLPFNFTISSQISFSFSMAMVFWTGIQMMGWLNYTKHMLSHLIPQGTPNALKPLMIIIEIISQLIRPITLSVRLTANMVAGHLLLSLLGSLMISSKMLFISSILASMALTFLEICVSVIQGYVFMMLVTLYSTEIN
uniref:ATP synthase subunit a n=1 Tax=Hygrobates taniguchii TaxID=2759127 RepID=A0A6J4EGD3_9ACAR|nr:ATPase subunit 6 [Hygrobates taniguchii]